MNTAAGRTRGAARPPELIIFDVNETLSDMTPLGDLWRSSGVPEDTAGLWFTQVLRDGFALAAALQQRAFADIARDVARRLLMSAGAPDVDAATNRIMEGFNNLDVHPDVPHGIRTLRALNIRLATLSNGSTSVADGLLTRARLSPDVEALLSVESAGLWKPAPQSYRFALDSCGTAPEKAMMVAVHPWDISGAAAVGMRTAWIARGGNTYPSHFTPPEITATSLTDLAQQLTPGAIDRP